MQLSEHFSLAEMIASQTAARRNIDNTPQPGVVDHLRTACAGLEKVRAALGHPLIVSSGYRSPALNRAVGGVDSSAHCQGWAVDFICPAFGTPHQVAEKIMASGIKFDQCICEGGANGWVHISFAPAMRQQALTAKFGPDGTTYSPGLTA